jgi:DNA primase
VTPASVARKFRLRRSGSGWEGPCPLGCGYSISIDAGDDGRLLAYCFGGHSFSEVIAAAAEIDPSNGEDDDYVDDDRDIVGPSRASEQERIDKARRLYESLSPAAGTIAETYLRSRGITIPMPSTLRFGACPHRLGRRLPAMVAPIVGVDGVLIGIHATFLRPDGSGKADFANPKCETGGLIRGGAIRLAPHDPSRELVIGEGVETVLSAMQIFGLPGWSAIYAGNLKRTMELPPAVRRGVIAADNDLAGRQAAAGAHQRWTVEGRQFRVIMPTAAGADFNDVLRGQ